MKKRNYAKEPKNKPTDLGVLSIGDLITHIKTGNTYKIMEIQHKGFIGQLVSGLDQLVGNDYYVADQMIDQYTK